MLTPWSGCPSARATIRPSWSMLPTWAANSMHVRQTTTCTSNCCGRRAVASRSASLRSCWESSGPSPSGIASIILGTSVVWVGLRGPGAGAVRRGRTPDQGRASQAPPPGRSGEQEPGRGQSERSGDELEILEGEGYRAAGGETPYRPVFGDVELPRERTEAEAASGQLGPDLTSNDVRE